MRAGIALVGSVPLAAGLGMLLAGYGAFGASLEAAPVLDPAVSRFAAGQAWFWPLAGAVTEGVAFAALVWLIVQVQALLRRWRPLLDAPTRHLAGVAAGELLRDTRLIPGVREARIRFTGSPSRPRVRVEVTCRADAAPARIHADLASGPVERYCAAMGMDDLVAVIRFRLDDPPPPPKPVRELV
ncbi:hypothetical protein [Actinomadura rugatobispora]|uniref:Alkaline shock response membrane anchor protein AmaP n=1 Tax=Actinomadura rugatobispora TaxID=1994 RepID=A0ABW0ZVU5_9ACTN|nr:hypothetical protein GCM10010200_028830 [Actinomadura rugatobispora]